MMTLPSQTLVNDRHRELRTAAARDRLARQHSRRRRFLWSPPQSSGSSDDGWQSRRRRRKLLWSPRASDAA